MHSWLHTACQDQQAHNSGSSEKHADCTFAFHDVVAALPVVVALLLPEVARVVASYGRVRRPALRDEPPRREGRDLDR